MNKEIASVSEDSIFSHGLRAVPASHLSSMSQGDSHDVKGGGGGYKAPYDSDNQSRKF